MAKGDSDRSQNAIGYQGGKAQNVLDNTQGKLNADYGQFQQNYKDASRQVGDYGNIMDNYKNISSGIAGDYKPFIASAQDFAGGRTGGVGLDNTNVDAALKGFKDYSETGGFGAGDIQDIRARAVSPTRSIYSAAAANIARQKGLTGGYTPNAAAAESQMARQQSQQISEADTNANAGIAQMVQQGKLYGLTGLGNTALSQQSNAIATANAGNQARLGGINAWGNGLQGMYGTQLDAAHGMTGAYSATPGLLGITQQGLLDAQRNQLQGSQLQNQLSLGIIDAQNQHAQIPGDFSQVAGNIGQGLGLVGDVAGAFAGVPPGMTTAGKQMPSGLFGSQPPSGATFGTQPRPNQGFLGYQ